MRPPVGLAGQAVMAGDRVGDGGGRIVAALTLTPSVGSGLAALRFGASAT
jgi:hypothetical protein